jgi:SAM-dependent methyltransferase
VRLTGIELSPVALRYAVERARMLGVAADLRLGDAQALPFEDGSFDTIVLSVTLCSIPEPGRAMREIARVLRPGGRLRALEHVGSDIHWVRLVQRLLDPLAVRVDADHLLRDPAGLAVGAGLRVESLERRRLGVIERLVARRPADR